MKNFFDCVVIGGGVVGVSIFNKIVRLGKSCALVDKASDVATGATKANSGLVHAGYDPLPNTLKAKLNVEGSKLFGPICKRLGVKLTKCGALVVGDNKEKIEELFLRGKRNGVNVEILGEKQLHQKVPNLAPNLTVALWAKDAALVSPYLFSIALAEEGILNGGKIFLEEDISKITKKDGIFCIKTQKNTLFCKNVVNSAGMGFNEIAKLLGCQQKKIELRKGEYFVFDKNSLDISCTIFPLPTALGKGVLVTPTVDGNFLVGPTNQQSDGTTSVSNMGLEEIKQKAKLIFPNINFKNAIRQFSGIRTICGDDFVIEKSAEGVVGLAGICSPGLSSAPAIAKMVAKMLGYGSTELKNLKKIEPYVMFKNMSKARQKQLLQTNKAYGEIVCKCEKITKGDVLNALARPLKISSVDGIKRRTNAGMGRCQGGFCFAKVVNLIAAERKIKYEQVQKENRGSFVAVGNLREVKND